MFKLAGIIVIIAPLLALLDELASANQSAIITDGNAAIVIAYSVVNASAIYVRCRHNPKKSKVNAWIDGVLLWLYLVAIVAFELARIGKMTTSSSVPDALISTFIVLGLSIGVVMSTQRPEGSRN